MTGKEIKSARNVALATHLVTFYKAWTKKNRDLVGVLRFSIFKDIVLNVYVKKKS